MLFGIEQILECECLYVDVAMVRRVRRRGERRGREERILASCINWLD